MSGAVLPLPLRAVMQCVGTNLLYNCDPKYPSQSQTARAVLCFFGYWIEVYRDFAQSVTKMAEFIIPDDTSTSVVFIISN
jgi:hypothetical protein